MNRLLQSSLVVVCAGYLAVAAKAATDSSGVDDLLDRAEALLRLGVAEKGASRAFEESLDLVEIAAKSLAETDLSPAERRALLLEIEAVREDLELLIELYEERFYGVFPLARLIIPTLLTDEGLGLTEQLFHPPEVAAVEIAARRLSNQIGSRDQPGVVFRSSPADRRLENVTSEVLLRDGRSNPILRRGLVAALSAEELDAFDRGEIDLQMIDRLLATVDAVSLVVVTVGPSVEIDDGGVTILLRGDLYLPGEVVQGSAVGASLVVRTASYVSFGSVRDRRDQFWPILGTELLLLVLAIAWAVRVPWSVGQPLTMFYRFAIGTALFLFGRTFVVVAVLLLRRVIPDSSAMVAAAWWWPALLGLLAILGGGLVAWIGQAWLTDIVPGARGARAVGSMFALVALGAGSYFVAPLLLLDGSRGFANLLPFVLASVSLAMLFGLAARTGPPVPHYFTIGPLLVAPLVGVCLLTASPGLLWAMVALNGFLCLAAWVRHRYALAHGTEEPEPSPEEAAQTDQERIVKLGQHLTKKL
ncbi:MAG: hypothetical protein WBQ30_00705 [Thermoanaerobaculia bacterium]